MSSVIFVGGFGASPFYSKSMCFELQRLTSRKVYNFSLKHGLSLDEECTCIIDKIDGDVSSQSFVLMGFSTGCLVAMELSKKLATEKVVLINPAELLTRMNQNLLDCLVNPEIQKSSRNISTYLPILKRSGYSVSTWKTLWILFTWIWWASIKFLGPSRVARIYYHYGARHFHEPEADELERLVFVSKINDLKTTLVECLLKPSLQHMIENHIRHVHIVEGYSDFLYIPYVKSLFDRNSNVILHRTIGDHHMIYHHPRETAEKVSAVILESPRLLINF